MAVMTVPRPLREKLGEEAAQCLADLVAQAQEDQRDRLFDLVEERFYRRIAETEQRFMERLAATEAALRREMHAGFTEVHRQILDVHKQIGDMHKQIGDVHKQIGEVRKEITTQTRWILVVVGAAAVLIPILQRVMQTLLP